MKNNFLILALLGASAALLGGCVTSRTVSFEDRDYNTVFKKAVSGLCSERKLLVYKADKEKGIIWVQSRGIMANPPETPIVLEKSGNTITAKVTMGGMNNPWADRMMTLISDSVATSKVKRETEGVSESSPGLNFERERLELEKEKLKLEKEKFEFEKRKHKKE